MDDWWAVAGGLVGQESGEDGGNDVLLPVLEASFNILSNNAGDVEGTTEVLFALGTDQKEFTDELEDGGNLGEVSVVVIIDDVVNEHLNSFSSAGVLWEDSVESLGGVDLALGVVLEVSEEVGSVDWLDWLDWEEGLVGSVDWERSDWLDWEDGLVGLVLVDWLENWESWLGDWLAGDVGSVLEWERLWDWEWLDGEVGSVLEWERFQGQVSDFNIDLGAGDGSQTQNNNDSELVHLILAF